MQAWPHALQGYGRIVSTCMQLTAILRLDHIARSSLKPRLTSGKGQGEHVVITGIQVSLKLTEMNSLSLNIITLLVVSMSSLETYQD